MRRTRKRITRRSLKKGGVRPQAMSNENRIKRAQMNIQTRKNSKEFLSNLAQRQANRLQMRKNANQSLKNHVNHDAMNNYLKEINTVRSSLRANAPSFVPLQKSNLRANAPAFTPY